MALQKDKEKGESSLDLADLELGRYFSDFEIPHTLATCHKHKHKSSSLSLSPQSQEILEEVEVEPLSAVEERIKESLRFEAKIPMLGQQASLILRGETI